MMAQTCPVCKKSTPSHLFFGCFLANCPVMLRKRKTLENVEYFPQAVYYEEAGFWEFIIEDTAYCVREGERYDTLHNLETREIIGFRWRKSGRKD